MKKQKIAIFASTMSIIASVLLIAFSAGKFPKNDDFETNMGEKLWKTSKQ